jgi:hypothetical protein
MPIECWARKEQANVKMLIETEIKGVGQRGDAV